MPNVYCTLADGDFSSYDTIQEIIAEVTPHLVKEKDLRGHIIIHISFFTGEDKAGFLQKITARLPALAWFEKP